jgi:outer membrane protein TolC
VFSAELDESDYGVSLGYDLPVDRLSERNRYRQAQINLERQRRSTSLAEDNIKLQVRQDYRLVQQAIETYSIQQESLKTAQKRVDTTAILIEAGRAITRDYLEAQRALVSAQNNLTSALVDLYIARLTLFLDMEQLRVDDTGTWSVVEGNGPENMESMDEH